MVNQPNEKQKRILQAARKAFDNEGYDVTTVDRIAAEAGVSKGSIYNYFSSKEEIFTELFRDILDAESAMLDELLARQGSAKAKLEAYLDHWLDRLGEYQKIGRLILEFWVFVARSDSGGEMNQTLRRMYSNWRKKIAEIIQQGRESGEFPVGGDSHTGAAIILGLTDGLMVQSIMDVGLVVDKDIVDGFKRGMFFALGVQTSDESDDRAVREASHE